MLSPRTAIKYLSVSWAVFYILAVLFGAPFFSDIVSTAVLSTCLTATSILPLVLIFDNEDRAFEAVLEGSTTPRESVIVSIAAFSLISAWAAAVVYPLDWDRWWQRYPLPSLFGCFGGALLGLLFGILRVFVEKRTSKKPKSR